jgi:hypothetical protein
MFTNALVSGVLAALYLGVLVLQLNPHVPLVSWTTVHWFGALLGMYGPYLTLALYVALLAREAVATRPLGAAWLSVRLLAWLGAAGAAGAAVIMWANLRGFLAVLTPEAAQGMRQGAIVTSAAAVVLVAIVGLRYSFGRRGNRAAAGLLIAALTASLAVPIGLRGPGEASMPAPRRPPASTVAATPRVFVVLIDGASRGFIHERVAAGRLPNFGKLLDRGALVDIATMKPTQATPVWAAAATGKYPPKNGVRSEYVFRVAADDGDPVNLLPDYTFAYALIYQGFVRAEPLTSQALQARPLWRILADYGVAAGIVNWPMTHSETATRGYLLSERFDDAASSPLRLADQSAGDPTTAIDIARPAFDAWLSRPWTDVIPAIAPGETEPSGMRAARWDRAFADASEMLDGHFVPRLTAVRFEGIDTFGHAYLRDAWPDRFAGVRRGDPSRSVLDRYYAILDAHIGRTMAKLGDGDLLFVMSGFGMDPVAWPRRVVDRITGAEQWGSHEAAPDGFLFVYGTPVAAGRYRRGSIVDLTPTVLYAMGLPVGRDMDGFARTDLFRADYTRDHSVVYR